MLNTKKLHLILAILGLIPTTIVNTATQGSKKILQQGDQTAIQAPAIVKQATDKKIETSPPITVPQKTTQETQEDVTTQPAKPATPTVEPTTKTAETVIVQPTEKPPKSFWTQAKDFCKKVGRYVQTKIENITGRKKEQTLHAHTVKTNNIMVLLNKAFADEWFAYYQYWTGAKVATGPEKNAVIAELIEHAQEELEHADMLAKRILELGGKFILEPKQWYKYTNCGFEAPTNPSTKIIVEQNIKAEQCAIKVYRKLLKLTKNKDPKTHTMLQKILEDEIEHEEDLIKLLKKIEKK